MSIKFICRSCNHQMKTGYRYAGQVMDCVKCGKPLKIPSKGTKSLKKKGSKEAKEEEEEYEEILEFDEIDFKPEEEKEFNTKASKKIKAKKTKPATRGPSFASMGGLAAKQKKLKDDKKKKKQAAKERREELANRNAKGNNKGESPISTGMFIAIIGGCFAFLALALGLGGGLMYWINESSKVEAPTEFAILIEKNSKLMCEYPVGWEATSGGGRGGIPAWMRFEKGNFEITVRGSNSGSAMGDVARAGATMAGGNDDIDLAPVRSIHDFQKKNIAKDFQNYEETEPEKIRTGLGDSRLSEFTSRYYMGYRATLLTSVHQYNVICKCKRKLEWEVYQPVFRKIIVSIARKSGR